jgi:MADS-box transcription factor
VSETGLVYTFTTPKLQPLVTKPEGKNLIQVRLPTEADQWCAPGSHPSQACLNAPEPAPGNENGVDGESAVESPEDVNNHPQIPAPPPNMARNPNIPAHYMTPEQQQQIAYQQYMQSQQTVPGQYPMPPQARMPHQQPPSG